MKTQPKALLGVGGIVLLASVLAFLVSHKPPGQKALLAESSRLREVAEPLSPNSRAPDRAKNMKYLPRPVVSAWPAVPTSNSTDETSLMSKLHELGETNPLLSLQLAREGNQRFPGSAEAPERAWIVCKSLVNLRRFEEARDEAKAMVEKYPDTSWTTDVQKHLLVNPLTNPAERGYGKTSELE